MSWLKHFQHCETEAWKIEFWKEYSVVFRKCVFMKIKLGMGWNTEKRLTENIVFRSLKIGRFRLKILSENLVRTQTIELFCFENHRNSSFGPNGNFKRMSWKRKSNPPKKKIMSEYRTFSRYRSFAVEVLKIIEIPIVGENRKFKRRTCSIKSIQIENLAWILNFFKI